MSFPRYPKYKDSGVEWLGEVPTHWEVRLVKRIASLLTDKAESREHPVALENIEGWTGRYVPSEAEFQGDGVGFRQGDILFGKLRPYLAKVYLAEFSGEAVGDFHVLRPSSRVVSRFLQYHFLTRSFIDIVDGTTFGAKMPRAAWDALGGMPSPLPPPSEQRAIATFLDHETAKIDALVAEQRRLIELLQEKRQAVISHAVTKGLNPDAPMKPSGIDWLGDVPEHWDVGRVKNASTFITSGPRGWSERIAESGPLFVQSGDLNDSLEVCFENAKRVQVTEDAESARTRLSDGDVVVCVTGAKTGNVAVCDRVPEVSFVNQHLCLIRPNNLVLSKFLGYFLKSAVGQTYFSVSQYGLKQGLSLEDVKKVPLLIPPLDEQRAILSHISGISKTLDELKLQADNSIGILQERRTALISAAVTGKIDVRGLVEGEAA